MIFKELSLPNELWLPVADTEGNYYVSNLGRILTTEYGQKKLTKVIKQSTHKNGYLVTRMKKESRVRPLKVHRLVAQAFIPNPNNLPQVNHIDGIKTNNVVTNLEWVTGSENIKHAFAIGLSCHKGSKHPQSILTEEQVKEIRLTYTISNCTKTDFAKKYGIATQTLDNVLSGRTWSHVN